MVDPLPTRRLDCSLEPMAAEHQMATAGRLLEQGELGAARSALVQLLEWDPGHLLAHEALLQAYLLMGKPALAHQEQTR